MASYLRLARAAARAAGAAGSALAVPFAAALAQPASQRAIPTAYAITNARVVSVAGPTIEKGTIVVRNGLIAAVGANVAVPADARVVDGAGLTVYPGFIDAYSTLGTPSASSGAQGGRGGGGNAIAALAAQASAPAGARLVSHPAGVAPEATVVEQLRVDADAFAGAHAAGFTTALSAPRGGILQGSSALIALGDDPATMVVKAPVAQHVAFTAARGGGFPNSLLGVFAALRQTLLDAQHYRDERAAYARNARGLARPAHDATLDALQPVIAREQPVVMQANTRREIERALGFAKEFNLRAIIAGGSEAHLVADQLKAAGVPVLLSANFPRRAAAPSADADPDPIRVLRERADAPKSPARLAQAGVRFAFQSGGATNGAELLANVQRAVESGLTPEQAARALTAQPAEILGVADRLGSIEVGKIANLTLLRGGLGERGARVAQLFVDGRPVTVRAAAPADAGSNVAAATGAWTTTVTLDGANHAVTLTLRQEGERVTGSLQGDLGTSDVAGTIGADGAFRLTTRITLKEGTEEATFLGNLEGTAIRGRVTIVGHEPGTFSGTRPERGPGAGARTPRE